MVVELGAPDDALIGAVLVKLFADRQLRIGPEVLRYLLPRMERSFAAARDLVAAIDQMALAKRREITVALAREALAGQEELGLGAEGRDQDFGKAGDSG
jgi:chromosomal replication initiation ATPase DnaA